MKKSILCFISVVFCVCGCSTGDKIPVEKYADFLGPQQVNPSEQKDMNLFLENYSVELSIIQSSKLKLVRSANDAYTFNNGKYIAISPQNRTFSGVQSKDKDSNLCIYAIIKPVHLNNGLIRLLSVRVKVTNGPLKGAIVTIKPSLFEPGEIRDTLVIRSLEDAVQAYYFIPKSIGRIKKGDVKFEVVEVKNM